jgi:uncharacterized repeat protein (TIGR03943 family)
MQHGLQALILAGLGLFLLQKAWAGTLYWYINERFLALVVGAAIGFLILARSVLPAWRAAPEPTHAHAAEGGHSHDHQHTPAWRLWIVALPLILGLLVPARPLGSSALANRGLNTSAPIAAADGEADSTISLLPQSRTVLDWVRAFNYADDPGVFTGEPADVIGFVYHDSTLDEGEFMVSRFTVTCCAADATGIGLRVQWPGAAALEGNAWVRVQGPVQPGLYAGRPIPVVVAESVEGVAPPAQPYLYP